MKRELATRALGKSGLRSVLRRLMRWSGVLCLNYHRIGSGAHSVFDRGLWSATAQDFDDQVGYLKAHYNVVDTRDLPQVLEKKSGQHVLITFDDGYVDNYEVAFPILKRHGVPATFFVSTGFLDSPRLPWWDEIAWMVRTSRKDRVELPPWLPAPVVFDAPDREGAVRTILRGYKQIPSDATSAYLDRLAEAAGTGRYDNAAARSIWMNGNIIREMHIAGMSIGGHTVTHPVLARMPREKQRQEIAGSVGRIREEINEAIRTFSYPVGGPQAFNTDTRECLQEAGVRFAFSYYGGYRRFDDWDDLDIRRLAVESYVKPEWFRAMVDLPQFFGKSAG